MWVGRTGQVNKRGKSAKMRIGRGNNFLLRHRGLKRAWTRRHEQGCTQTSTRTPARLNQQELRISPPGASCDLTISGSSAHYSVPFCLLSSYLSQAPSYPPTPSRNLYHRRKVRLGTNIWKAPFIIDPKGGGQYSTNAARPSAITSANFVQTNNFVIAVSQKGSSKICEEHSPEELSLLGHITFTKNGCPCCETFRHGAFYKSDGQDYKIAGPPPRTVQWPARYGQVSEECFRRAGGVKRDEDRKGTRDVHNTGHSIRCLANIRHCNGALLLLLWKTEDRMFVGQSICCRAVLLLLSFTRVRARNATRIHCGIRSRVHLPTFPTSPVQQDKGNLITCPQRPRSLTGREGHGKVVRLLASHQDEPGSIPGGVTPPPHPHGSSDVGVAPDDAAGRRVSSGNSPPPPLAFLALLHTHLASPSSTLKNLLLRAALISSFTRSPTAPSTARLLPRRFGFYSRRGRSRIFACEDRPGRYCWSAGLLGDLRFARPYIPPLLHTPHFTFIGSQHLDDILTSYRLVSGMDPRVPGQETKERYGRHLTRMPSVSSLLRAGRVVFPSRDIAYASQACLPSDHTTMVMHCGRACIRETAATLISTDCSSLPSSLLALCLGSRLARDYGVTTETVHGLRVGAKRHWTCVLVSPVSLPRFLTLDRGVPTGVHTTLNILRNRRREDSISHEMPNVTLIVPSILCCPSNKHPNKQAPRTILSCNISPPNLTTAHQGEPDLVPGRVTPGFSHVGIVPDDAVGRRVFSGTSRPPFHSDAAPYTPQ
ncbi:hypothetical protein PR048_006232 [Dryococelus australis]|uniref:Uncharacterized protein n=1 Tax=Dryococelus australis TaxID=614101 RepID=A0ABQ9IAZ5_9NEOP|nr:hypothetical protein PR048_006232 [Dryococelus australis]